MAADGAVDPKIPALLRRCGSYSRRSALWSRSSVRARDESIATSDAFVENSDLRVRVALDLNSVINLKFSGKISQDGFSPGSPKWKSLLRDSPRAPRFIKMSRRKSAGCAKWVRCEFMERYFWSMHRDVAAHSAPLVPVIGLVSVDDKARSQNFQSEVVVLVNSR